MDKIHKPFINLREFGLNIDNNQLVRKVTDDNPNAKWLPLSKLNDDLEIDITGIKKFGVTGFVGEKDGRGKVSFLGADIDLSDEKITDHNSAKDIQAFLNLVEDPDFPKWLTVKHSAGGKGLHIFVNVKEFDADYKEYLSFAKKFRSWISEKFGLKSDKSIMFYLYDREKRDLPNSNRLIKKSRFQIKKKELLCILKQVPQEEYIAVDSDKYHENLAEKSPIKQEIRKYKTVTEYCEEFGMLTCPMHNSSKSINDSQSSFKACSKDIAVCHAPSCKNHNSNPTAGPIYKWLVILIKRETDKDIQEDKVLRFLAGYYGLGSLEQRDTVNRNLSPRESLLEWSKDQLGICEIPQYILEASTEDLIPIQENSASVVQGSSRANSDTKEKKQCYTLDRLRYCYRDGNSIGYYRKIGKNWVSVEASTLRKVFGTKLINVAVYKPCRVDTKHFVDREEIKLINGERVWYKDGCNYLVEPVAGDFPSWNMLFNHLGKNIIVDDWCKANGIMNGTDYLMTWVASAIQNPEQKCPYLFFFSESQNTGKSTFHEALQLLVDGVVSIKLDLTSNHNDKLGNVLFGVIDEHDVSGNNALANRVKELTTSSKITVNPKGQPAYQTKNYLHFIQTGNDVSYAPLSKEKDTRITFIKVSALEKDIPWANFKKMLQKEAGCILFYLINMLLPNPAGRFAIPTLDSKYKEMMNIGGLHLREFFQENIIDEDGSVILQSDLVEYFEAWMDENGTDKSSIKTSISNYVTRNTTHLIKGRVQFSGLDKNKTFYGNIKFADDKFQSHKISDTKLKAVDKKVGKENRKFLE